MRKLYRLLSLVFSIDCLQNRWKTGHFLWVFLEKHKLQFVAEILSDLCLMRHEFDWQFHQGNGGRIFYWVTLDLEGYKIELLCCPDEHDQLSRALHRISIDRGLKCIFGASFHTGEFRRDSPKSAFFIISKQISALFYHAKSSTRPNFP